MMDTKTCKTISIVIYFVKHSMNYVTSISFEKGTNSYSSVT